jgi:23S rRNA (cytidine1920-2'-O)/16S rRNA (cytidine1409-2'-O)-methyltransferase
VTAAEPRKYASRAGLKLEHALRELDVDVTGLLCADFGCNVGGFTDCLLKHGAARVIAIDTGYGTLAYELRRDERVEVRERTNALHADPPDGGVDLVTIDLAWTPQRHGLPAALRWLRGDGRILTLVKPHYELSEDERRADLVDGRLAPERAEAVLQRTLERMPEWGARSLGWTRSPLTGGKSSRKRRSAPGAVGPGNIEFVVLAEATPG